MLSPCRGVTAQPDLLLVVESPSFRDRSRVLVPQETRRSIVNRRKTRRAQQEHLRRNSRAQVWSIVRTDQATVGSAAMQAHPNGIASEPSATSAFQPTTVGGVELRNRIFVPAHTTNFGLDHLPTDTHVAYHEARARGGVGLIIMESLRVHPTSL